MLLVIVESTPPVLFPPDAVGCAASLLAGEAELPDGLLLPCAAAPASCALLAGEAEPPDEPLLPCAAD